MSRISDEAERARQRALDTYRIVDTLPEAAYDDIVRIASLVCGAPVALISLLDRDRQWFKARIGIDVAETPRDEAVCDHAIRRPQQLFEVRDLAGDSRFAQLPVVTGTEQLRFYAGVPLVTPGGAAIGTVCVLDREPRTLDESQRAALAALARLAMNLVEGRRRERELERDATLTRGTEAPVAANDGPEGPTECTIALFELQDFAGASVRHGERALERALEKLDRLLEAELRGHHGLDMGHSVSRASGSAEIVAVLHGHDRESALARLRVALAGFQRETGLVVLSAIAERRAANEALGTLFQRADEALTEVKNSRAATASR